MAAQSGHPVAVYGALVANGIIAVTKFVAGGFTGSSAMISEGIHSLVDTGNQGLILLGLRRAKKPSDARHPFGYGKELYFWSFVVAIILFALGGGFSIYEGIEHIRHPVAVENPIWNYLVLGIAFVVEMIAWALAYRELRAEEGPDVPLLRAVRRSKNPAVFTVLVEDTAATLGLVIAFLGVYLGHTLQMPVLDGIASVLIGVVLVVMAGFLAFESHGLLIGEGATRDEVERLRAAVAANPDVTEVREALTLHFGPREVLVNVAVRFRSDLPRGGMADAVDGLERTIRDALPEATRIFVEAEGIRRSGEGSAP